MRPDARQGPPKCVFKPLDLTKAQKAEILSTGTPRALPATRADCVDGPRPCQWISCRHNNFLDIGKGGGIKYNYPSPEDVPPELSCSLDIAEEGEHDLHEVGRALRLTRQATEQAEETALKKLRLLPVLYQIWEDFEPNPCD